MQIRKSTEKDVARMMEIYAYARRFMAEHGNPNQWGPRNWPPEALLREDIAAGKDICFIGLTGNFVSDDGIAVSGLYFRTL